MTANVFNHLDLTLASVRLLRHMVVANRQIGTTRHPLNNLDIPTPTEKEDTRFAGFDAWRPLLAYGLCEIVWLENRQDLRTPTGQVCTHLIAPTRRGEEWVYEGFPPIRPPASAMTAKQRRAARFIHGRRTAA